MLDGAAATEQRCTHLQLRMHVLRIVRRFDAAPLSQLRRGTRAAAASLRDGQILNGSGDGNDE
jgi:hypothetical protein